MSLKRCVIFFNSRKINLLDAEQTPIELADMIKEVENDGVGKVDLATFITLLHDKFKPESMEQDIVQAF